MTHYRRFNENQAKDPELVKIVANELALLRSYLQLGVSRLVEALESLQKASAISEDYLSEPSGIAQSKAELKKTIERFNRKITSLENPSTEYLTSITGFLNTQQVEELKGLYSDPQ